MRFLFDMGISPKSASFLQMLGYEAVHLHDQGLERLPDSAILEKARREGRILLTHDLDFGVLMAASGSELPSVVVFRLRDMRPTNVNRHLQYIVAQYQEVLEQRSFVSVKEGQIRVRLLPIHPSPDSAEIE